MPLRPVKQSKFILNHVLNLQRFSLPNYLRFARPWAREPDHILLKLVFGIAQVQHENDMRWCIATLSDDPPARNTVQAILRDEERHLQILCEELDHGREGETPSPSPTTALKPSIPALEDIYGDALDRWTNEGGALGE
jgi:hypothetical protein